MDELDPGQTVRGFVPGQRLFGRYILKTILGRGGMGIVWRAQDEHLDRDVALKFLPELIIHDPAVLDDLKRETRRNLDLTHHHIVRIYDFAQDSQSACISMEFVDGETLSALRVAREDKIFRPDELAQPMAELCEALTYAHTRAAIVHRDLKPANLMLTSKGVLKVTDFGIARSLSDSISMLTMGRGISGTLLYMSPQQLSGERPSAADDIYSVGATIYELLTSKPPFFTGSIERQIEVKVPPPMAARRSDLGIMAEFPIPEHWERCVADCLAKDPEKRPASAALLAERLRDTAPPPPPPPPAPSPPPPLREIKPSPLIGVTPRKSRTGIYAGVIAAVVLAAGGAALLLNRSSPQQPANAIQSAPQAAATVSPPSETVSRSKPETPVATVDESPRPTVAETTPANTPLAPSKPATRSAAYSATDGYNPSLALVDLNRAFKEYGKTKDAEQKVNAGKDAAKKEYDDRAENYKKLLDQINKAKSTADRDALIAKAKAMEKEINDFRTTREKQLQDEAANLRTEIVNEITGEIARLNTTAKSVVLDRSGNSLNGVPVLMLAPDQPDMTTRVIGALNGKGRASFPAIHDLALAVVDMNGIFKAYHKTKTSEAKINDAKETAKKEYDARAEDYKKALDGINRLNQQLESTSLSAASRTSLTKQRDDAIAAIKTQEKEINEFRQTRERQLQEQAMRMRESIVKEITDAIGGGVPKTNGALILDLSGMSSNGVPLVVQFRRAPDLSAEVIAFLNGSQAAGTIKFQQSFARTKTLRFGVVDMNRAFKAWPETKASEAKINDAKDAAKKEYDERSENYKKQLDRINTAKSSTERDALIAMTKVMEKEITEFRAAREKQLQEQALRMREAIVAKITAALKRRVEREKFDLVFDSSGPSLNGVPLVISAPGMPDLSDGLETE